MVIAGRVLATGNRHLVSRQFLRAVSYDISLALLADHMTDIAFLSLDVIRYLVGLIFVLPVFEDRSADPFLVDGVIDTTGVYLAAVDVHSDVFRVQFHLLVGQHTLAVQISRSVACHDHRVVRLVVDRGFQVIFCLRLGFLRLNTVSCLPISVSRSNCSPCWMRILTLSYGRRPVL